MDLRLVAEVAWRFRVLVAVGLLVAALTAFFTAYGISGDGFSRRGVEQWSSSATLLVTQPGGPETRSAFPVIVPPAASPGASQTYIPAFGDPGYLTRLAGVYAKLAISNEVRRGVLGARVSDPTAGIEAEQITNRQLETQPFVLITGLDATAGGAVDIRDRTVTALKGLLLGRQVAAKTPTGSRVILEEVVSPSLDEVGGAELLAGRSRTLPVALFLLIGLATFGLAFVLENLRPRVAAATGAGRGRATGRDGSHRELGSARAAGAPDGARHEVENAPAESVDVPEWPEIVRETR